MIEPTMALAMPPPVSPTGRGLFTRNSKLSDRNPPTRMCPRMTNSRPSTSTAHNPVTISIKRLKVLRRHTLRTAVPPIAARNAPYKHARQYIDQKCNHKKNEAKLDKGTQVHFRCCLGE